MSVLQALWRDQSGAIMSAELVVLSTVGVVGATVGLGMLANSVNEELEDVAKAIRHLDQSYEVVGYSGPTGWKAGSRFVQQDIETSIRELEAASQSDETQADDGPVKAPIPPRFTEPPVPPDEIDQLEQRSAE